MRHRMPVVKLPHRRALERQRIEPAYLQKRRVAAEFAQQRLDRGVLEHHPRDQRAPHRPNRVVVAAPAARRLQRRNDLPVGKHLEHQPQTRKVRQTFDIAPRKG